MKIRFLWEFLSLSLNCLKVLRSFNIFDWVWYCWLRFFLVTSLLLLYLVAQLFFQKCPLWFLCICIFLCDLYFTVISNFILTPINLYSDINFLYILFHIQIPLFSYLPHLTLNPCSDTCILFIPNPFNLPKHSLHFLHIVNLMFSHLRQQILQQQVQIFFLFLTDLQIPKMIEPGFPLIDEIGTCGILSVCSFSERGENYLLIR